MKKLWSLLLAGLMLFSVSGCGSSSKSTDTLTVGAEELSGTFSPIYYSSSYDGYVVDMVYSKLMDYDLNHELHPMLAESTDVSEDGKSVTFNLKKGIKFSDGSTFDAEDVAFTFKVVSDPSYDGRYGGTVKYLDGYDNYSKKGNASEPEYPGIEVIDPYTIKFSTVNSRNDSLVTLGTNFAIISKEQFKDYKYGDTKPVKDLVKKPVGTGPYVLKKWESGAGASLSKNAKYSGEALGKGFAIKNVIIKPVKMTTEYQELESGNVDLLSNQIEPKKVGPASQNKDLKLNHYPRGGQGYITLNAGRGATTDQAVRQALLYGFDRQSFVDSFYDCPKCKNLDGVDLAYVPTTYNNPLSSLGDIVMGKEKLDGMVDYTYDINKAKTLLDNAGWVVGSDGKRSKDGQKLTVRVLSIEDHDILSNLIPMWKKSWGEELGADVQVASVTFNTLLDKITNDKNADDWNVFFMASQYTSTAMTDVLQTFHSKFAVDGGDNYARLKDSELDDLLDESLSIMDKEAELESWKKTQIKINEDATSMPVYGNTYFDMYNKRLKNFKTNALYAWPRALKDATLE